MKNKTYAFTIALCCLLLGIRCSSDSSLESSGTGQAGSLASFLIVGDFLYLLADNQLKTFHIDDVDRAKPIDAQPVGAITETIFHRNGVLYLGTRTGMYTYQIQNNGIPRFTSEFQHITGCDPVIANEKYAFVTVHSGFTCSPVLTSVNSLYVMSLEDPLQPQILREYPMQKPLGMGLHQQYLLLCEQEFGLKVLDTTDPLNLQQRHHYTDVHALDVIVLNQSILLLTPDNIVQYTIADNGALTRRSEIPVLP